MVTVRSVSKNDEIYNTFGELSNSCLLTKYGFTELDNPFDTVDLKVSLVLSVLPSDLLKERFEFVSKLLKQKVYEIGYNGEVEENLVRVLGMCLLSDEDYTTWKSLPKEEKRDAVGQRDPILSGRIAQTILSVLEQRSGRYPTTLEQDEQSLVPYSQFSFVECVTDIFSLARCPR